MDYKFYTFYWAYFRNGELVSQDDFHCYIRDGYPDIESLKKGIKELVHDEYADIMIDDIKKIRKARYELLTGHPFSPRALPFCSN